MESAQVGGIGFNNYVARHDNLDSINVNPAGLGEKNPKAVNMTYRTKFSEMESNDLGLSGVWDNFGLGLDVGDFGFKSPAGEMNTNMAFYGGTGFSLSKNILIGTSVTYYMKDFDKEFPNGIYSGIYFSPGVILKMGEQISFGLLGQNLGWEMKKGEKETFKLQKTVRGCLQFEPDKGLFLMGGASYYEGATNVAGSIGAEYTLKIASNGSICLRGGYDSSSLSYGGLTSGVGFILDQQNQDNRVQLDYSITSNPTVGLIHRISISGLWPSQAEKKLAEKPSIKVAEGPAEVKTEETPVQISVENKYLTVTGGTVLFQYKRSELSDLTEAGKKYLSNAKKLIRCLCENGLCAADEEGHLDVIVDGNASAEGTEDFNYTLSEKRAEAGRTVVKNALEGVVDPESLKNILINPQGDKFARKYESDFRSEWQDSHGGEAPTHEELEIFRQAYRNFKINIKLNIEKWPDIKKKKETIKMIDSLSPGLSQKIEDTYKAAIRKH